MDRRRFLRGGRKFIVLGSAERGLPSLYGTATYDISPYGS